MRHSDVVPNGTFHHLGEEEILVSKTDPRGVLTYVNEVFCRMAAMTEEELLGQPHNVIRHPEMPRSIFKLLWDTIAAGQEIFAYVINLAADGSSYWVLAHVTPSFDNTGKIIGYHSNRRAPQRAALSEIKPLYDALLTAEEAAPSTPAAVSAGTALLNQTLRESGQSYDEFVWSVINSSKIGAKA